MHIDGGRYEKKSICLLYFLPGVFMGLILLATPAAGDVIKQGSGTYLVDRTGEQWDILQAVFIGYDPRKFEFGIGRHAFRSVDENDWASKAGSSSLGMRVIGVAGNGHAHAYAVERLRYYKTANTFLGTQPILAGF